MSVKEDISLDPRIGAVEIEVIVACAVKDIVDHLQNGARTVAACKIHSVIVPKRMPEIVVAQNSMPACFDAAGAVNEFKQRRGCRKCGTADNERRCVYVHIGRRRVAESEVIEPNRAGIYLQARDARAAGIEFKMGVAD